MNSKRNALSVLGLAAVMAVAGCSDDLMIPDFNNPSLSQLESNPTPTLVNAAAQGLLIGARSQMSARNGYTSLLGILGRESYNFDGSDPRFITEMLEGDLDPGSPAFGANLWGQRYANIRNTNILLNALVIVPNMTNEEKAGVSALAKTIQAWELLLVVNTRDENGAVIDTNRPFDADPAPIVGKTEALAFISTLLDEAATELDGAGGSFSFILTSGFAGFDTPATFREFNRGLKARVEVYRGNWQAALDALAESFIDGAGDLTRGVYHSYGTGSGDATNALFDPGQTPDILAHPAAMAAAETKPGGGLDDRIQAKIRTVTSQTQRDITTDLGFAHYATNTTPIPWMRNEELILLRADANIGLGNVPQAITDINDIRTRSGGLAARGDLDASNVLDELLTQRWFSLLFEGGHRWIDMRRYDRLDQLPLDLPTHQVNAMFPIPEAETLARQGI